MKSIKLFFCICIFALHNIVILHARGNYPQRIVSLGPVITEQLYLLGVEDRIVGVTTYCKRPHEAQEKEKIGTVMGVNVEKIVSLKPDLVVSISLTNLKTKRKLKKLGIRVVNFNYPKSFYEICRQFAKIGKIVGEREKAKEIVVLSKGKVNYIRRAIRKLDKPKVFIQIGTKPLWTVPKKTFMNDFIEFAGGINIAYDTKTGLYSREQVIKKNPDVIIIVTMGIIGEKEKRIWQKYKTVNAVKKGRIYFVDSYKLCSPTPETFVEVLEEIKEILHPEETGVPVRKGKRK